MKTNSTHRRNNYLTVVNYAAKEARKNLKRAQNLYKEGQYRDSLRHAESIYTEDPSNVDNLILLGAIHFQRRNVSESMFYSQQCIRVIPSCAEALCIMGNCLKEMGDISSAISFYNKAVRFSPRNADAYNNLGLALFQMSKPYEAIETMEIAVSLDPSHCDALCNIATVYKTLGRLDDAKHYNLEAIKVNPECAIGWSNLGGIYNESGSYEQAITCYHRALKIAPHFADAISNCGNALFNKGKEANDQHMILEALAKYKEALELRSDFPLCRSCLGSYHLHTGSIQEARNQLRQAILQDDTMFDAMNTLSTIYFREGRFDDSLKLALRVVQYKPIHWCAYINLGNVLKEKGFYVAAAISYNISMAIKSTSSHHIQSAIASILIHLQKSEDALEYFQNAIDEGPLNEITQLNLGVAYISLGQMENAQRCIELCCEDGRNEFELLYSLAILHQRKGDLDSALMYCEKALEKVDSNIMIGGEIVAKQTLLANRLMDYLKLATCDWTDMSPCQEAVHPMGATCSRDSISMSGSPTSRDGTLRLPRDTTSKYMHREIKGKIRICYIIPPQSESRFSNLHCHHDESRFNVFFYVCPLNMAIDDRTKNEIRKKDIHILVYPCGIPFHASSLRLAPIQISFRPEIEMQEIDHIIMNDRHCHQKTPSSPSLQGVFYNPSDGITIKSSFESRDNLRPKYGVPEEAFVYASFQQPFDIDPFIFNLWMNILRKEGGFSILLLIRHNERMEVNLKAEAEKRNVDPERLIFIDPADHQEHTERYSMIDLYLDSGRSDGGQTSICEALLSGTPVVSFQTSNTSKILSNMGLGNFVVSSTQEYEALAVSMQFDEETFISIIKNLDDKLSDESPFFDNDKWVQAYEDYIVDLFGKR